MLAEGTGRARVSVGMGLRHTRLEEISRRSFRLIASQLTQSSSNVYQHLLCKLFVIVHLERDFLPLFSIAASHAALRGLGHSCGRQTRFHRPFQVPLHGMCIFCICMGQAHGCPPCTAHHIPITHPSLSCGWSSLPARTLPRALFSRYLDHSGSRSESLFPALS